MRSFPGFSIEIARNAEGGDTGGGTAGTASGGEGGGQGGGGGDSATPPAFDWAGTLGTRHAEFAPTLTAKGWKDPADLLSAYSSLEKDSAGRLAIPGEGATDEERAAFYAALGRPATAKDYGLAKPEGMPDAEWDGERMGRFGDAAHALGLSAAQAKGIIDWLAKDTNDQITAFEADLPKRQEAHQAKLREGLQKTFGAEAPAALERAKRAYATYVTDEAAKAAIDMLSEKAGEVEVIKMFAAIGRDIGESRMKGSGGGSSFGALTPDAAKAQLATLNADPKWVEALYSADHAEHAKVVEERRRLFEMAYPAT